MASLLVGPLVRFASEREAVVWVETDAACEVEVLGRRERTFEVAGHHYALVALESLEPGRTYEYTVACDGVVRWPDPGSRFPPSAIRTLDPARPVRLVFGSCRATAPHVPPFTLSPDESEHGFGHDALHAFALRMADQPRERWPDALLLLGDQVYADEASPATREFARRRRDIARPPGSDVADFEEYTRLYRESWTDETTRWLLSNVASAMVFDDHDVHDDWNISLSWVEDMRREPWWHERIVGAFMSYWVYQHLGNLAPAALAADETLRAVREQPGDAAPLLREFAFRADRTTDGTMWSFRRDFGRSRVVVVDSRAGRLLGPGRREMVDDEEWRWIVEQCSGEVDHLVLGTSLPFLLPRGIHDLEAWNEAVCGGAWGALAARAGESIRRAVDLEHWAAFGASFRKLADLLCEVAAGGRGGSPRSIVCLSGDVHYSYLARLRPPDGRARCPIYQAVCSPIRNRLARKERLAQRFAMSRAGEAVGAALARGAGVPETPLRWSIDEGPWFENCISSLELDGERATLRVERAVPELETVLERRL